MKIIFDKNRYHQQDEMIAWCRENIGPGGWYDMIPDDMDWSMGCVFGRTTFCFKNEQDCTLFLLKWG
jgi:hypothetical protein